MRPGQILFQVRCLVLVAILAHVPPAFAFPPYRTTDADTADPYVLEVRLGLVKLERDNGKTETITPLLRANYGLPEHAEIISEFEYNPSKNKLEDGAVGFKWVPFPGNAGIGIETLVLLPVNRSLNGLGVESQLLATYRWDSIRIHVNAGGFSDPRGAVTETGWRASSLVEIPAGASRFGLELFAKNTTRERTDVRAGAGLTHDFGGFEVRTGVHFGLTENAPDIGVSLWISTSFFFFHETQR